MRLTFKNRRRDNLSNIVALFRMASEHWVRSWCGMPNYPHREMFREVMFVMFNELRHLLTGMNMLTLRGNVDEHGRRESARVFFYRDGECPNWRRL